MKEFKKDALYFIPLGGSEQFGMNMNAYICNDEILVVDCGIGFADERFPGIEILLPDTAFLEARQKHITGLIVTHAHEDHIGAVARLWKRFKCPVYASPFTAEILIRKFDEEGITNPDIRIVKPMSTVQIGGFKTQFVPVAHSIPDACALIIETPLGRVVHSGDWNLDPNPVTGKPTNPQPFRDAGKAGVLAYIGDSTNAEVDGTAGSESCVADGLASEFKLCEGRIFVTLFSSNIGRVISIARAAQKSGRKVGVVGRSLHRMIEAARSCGYMKGIPDFIDEDDIQYQDKDKIVVIVTGSQGEFRAALARIARGEFREINVQRGDTVIFSAREIPGNERQINEVKNNLSATGVRIITPRDTDNKIHVSGHPCRDEIREMFQWVKPQIVVPVHGERTQLDAHARLAREAQIKHVIVPNNGSVIQLAPAQPAIIDHVETGMLAVDQQRIISADHRSIVERRKLQYTGVIHVSLLMDKKGKIKGEPVMETLGLFDLQNPKERRAEDRLYEEIFDVVDNLPHDKLQDIEFVEDKIGIALRRSVKNMLGIRPKTTVHVLVV